MLPVSLYVSTDWSLSLPKVFGLILGIAIFYAVVNAISTIRRVELATAGLILFSLAVSVLGLLGADWAKTKLFFLPKCMNISPI